MNCENHEEREATGSCVECGKLFCDDCIILVDNKRYCKDCVSDILSKEELEAREINITQETNIRSSTNSKAEADEKNREAWKKLKNLGNYFGVLLFVFMGFGAVVETAMYAILFFITAILFFPPLQHKFEEKGYPIHIIKWVFTILVIIGFGAVV